MDAKNVLVPNSKLTINVCAPMELTLLLLSVQIVMKTVKHAPVEPKIHAYHVLLAIHLLKVKADVSRKTIHGNSI